MTPDLAAAARDLYSGLVSEHGHDEKHAADWPSCLPIHIAMNRYRDAAAAPAGQDREGLAAGYVNAMRAWHNEPEAANDAVVADDFADYQRIARENGYRLSSEAASPAGEGLELARG